MWKYLRLINIISPPSLLKYHDASSGGLNRSFVIVGQVTYLILSAEEKSCELTTNLSHF